MYVTVSPGGTITFRPDYRLNGGVKRSRSVATGRRTGSAADGARALRGSARRRRRPVSVPRSSESAGRPRPRPSKSSHAGWKEQSRMAETKSMRKSIIDRDILPVFPQSADGPRSGRVTCATCAPRSGARRAGHRRTRARHRRRASASQPCTAREGAESGGRSRPLVDRHLRGQGPRARRRPRSAACTACWTPPQPCRPSGLALPDPADARAQSELIEATWDGDRLRERRLDDPEEPHEGRQAPQR